MTLRKTPFVNGEYYHIFNRGVAKMQIFNNFYDYNRFLKTFIYYSTEGPKPRFSIFTPETTTLDKNKKIIDLICYCLMPNHFHFLVKQNREKGITEFASKLSNSYTKYYNLKNKRVGPLLQGDFKAVHVETNEQLLHLTRYIHLNPLISYVTKDLEDHRFSSYREFVGLDSTMICTNKLVLEQFNSSQDYKRFVSDYKSYAQKLEMIRHQLIDLEE